MSKLTLQDPSRVRLDESGRSPAYVCRGRLARVDAPLVAELIEAARARGGQDLRLCLHDRPEAPLHEMVVVAHAGRYARPHKHRIKSESYHVIQGRARLVVFDDQGAPREVCELSAAGAFLYLVGPDQFHCVIPQSDVFVYQESRPGPFTPGGDSEPAPWAPDGQDAAAAQAFTARCLAFPKS